ncbi:MAG: Gfo/Idh/MocA family oxidoreductase [Lachnospiraceae bacterium]|nr:Gfo/Idh/MocA family oxidoreductase [Lachnospiraceae bacterium]
MKQVTAVLIGAGLRGGHVYSSYALEHPDEFKVVAVAEPDEMRRLEFAVKHEIPEEMQFKSYEELLERERMADCALVCTQDTMHYRPVIGALEKEYHVLCEKPMSPDGKEIVKMGEMAQKYGRILSICHVLRYSPFFVKIKELLEEQKIGRLMSIQHREEVGYWHHAHSFVRGNWRNAEKSSPMILQKCCHDMDILLWLVQSHCKTVSSFGALTFFKEENAPEGAPARCLDGCSYRDECPYYAPRFYLEHPKAEEDGLIYAVTSDIEKKSVLQALKSGPYGRCVFHCDNTVVDHQVVNLEFENGVTAALTMSAFTKNCAREINLMGTKGQIRGNMESGMIEVYDFVNGITDTIHLNTPPKGHGGSDMSMMKNFVQLVMEGKGSGKTGARVSVESHLMALAAEQSRVNKATVDFEAFKKELVCSC